MRLIHGACLRALLRNLTYQQRFVPRCTNLATNSRLRNDCNDGIGFGFVRDFQVRWRSTVGVVELDQGRDGKNVREILPDVQHAFVNHTFKHGYGTLLSCPGGISVDLEGELVFISDTLQNRIIVINAEGKVLDQIGSVSGFEDGSFESGKLQRPTSIIYDPDRSCLLIADSENHAIRRADLVSRTLETVYPMQHLETPSLIRRLFGVLGLKKSFSSFVKGDNGGDQESRVQPWHLVTKHDGHVLAATKGFDKLWNIDVDTGEAVEDPEQETDAIFKKFMKFKFSDIRGSELDWMHVHETLANKGLACEGFPNLVSQVTTLKHQVLVLDSEMHHLLKMDLSTGKISTMELSNLGLLGFPAQCSSPVNFPISSSLGSTRALEGPEYKNRPEGPDVTFQVRPGRCLICVDVALPRGTVLAEPVTDECLWRQGRGSVVELSIFGGKLTEQTVSAAQQYLDDLHSLEESQASIVEETLEEYLPVPKQSPTGLPFYSNVDISLGTGEVLLDAVIHLKRDGSTRSGHTPEIICNPSSASGSSHIRNDSVSEKTSLAHAKKLEDFAEGALMVKHLNLRVKFEASEEASLTRMILLDVQL